MRPINARCSKQVGDALPDFGVDDRQIDATQIKQRLDVIGGAARNDRQDMQVITVFDDLGYLGRQTRVLD